jgi:hypothetical protein
VPNDDAHTTPPGEGNQGARSAGGPPPPEPDKNVDEGWKAEARREKEKLAREAGAKGRKGEEGREPPAAGEPPPADFLHFVSGIAAQALMQLGEIENPFEGKKVVDLRNARYSIEILQMLEEKTRGNLTQDEERYIRAALHDLRMRFVAAASPSAGSSGPGSRNPPPGGGGAGGTAAEGRPG